MGQKTHPVGFRLGVIRGWSSKWYSEKDFTKWLHEDLRLKKFVKQKLNHAGVSSVEVERAAEKARYEWYHEGRVPLHTLRADIEYGTTEAHTTYGAIGVKCWIFKGEVLPQRGQKLA